MTTLVEALRAVERGDPFATRKAVDAMGMALEVLSERAEDTTTTTTAAESRAKR